MLSHQGRVSVFGPGGAPGIIAVQSKLSQHAERASEFFQLFVAFVVVSAGLPTVGVIMLSQVATQALALLLHVLPNLADTAREATNIPKLHPPAAAFAFPYTVLP